MPHVHDMGKEFPKQKKELPSIWFMSISGIGAVSFTALDLALHITRTDAIIWCGIRTYKALCSAVFAVNIIFLCLMGLSAIYFFISRRKQAQEGKALMPEGYAPDRLESESLQGELSMLKGNCPMPACRQVIKCEELLQQMDRQQEKLEKLLADNEAASLSDTKDVLDQVERYICRKVRAVLNYLTVTDMAATDLTDMKKVVEKTDWKNWNLSWQK